MSFHTIADAIERSMETHCSHYIELFEDRRGARRWRIRAANGRILATSEAYAERRNAQDTVAALLEAIEARSIGIRDLGDANRGGSAP
jgi:uncharacterized protein YegP (UPF0339 family)